jgi:hypothetical protein
MVLQACAAVALAGARLIAAVACGLVLLEILAFHWLIAS